MAVGLPAISTKVNGIPELLTSEFLVAPGEVSELAAKVKRLADSKKIYEKASKENIERVQEYGETKLQKKEKY